MCFNKLSVKKLAGGTKNFIPLNPLISVQTKGYTPYFLEIVVPRAKFFHEALLA